MPDALVTLLNNVGYMPVFLPRAGLVPPDLYDLGQHNKLIYLGPLSAILPNTVKLPTPSRNALPDIHHQETSKKSLKAAASFLEHALKCIGVVTPVKLDLSFAGATELSFSFSEVSYAAIPPTKLLSVIQEIDATGIPQNNINSGRLHIAYDYAYARKLLLRRCDHSSFKYDVRGIKVGSFIDIGTGGKVEAEDATTIAFKSNGHSIAFAYKAGQLVRHRGQWQFNPEIKGRGFLAEHARPYLPARGVVLADETSS